VVEGLGGYMKIYDVSMSIKHDMAVYNNSDEKRPLIKVMKDFSNSTYFESRIEMDMHTGTHIDAPLHMIQDGETMDSMDLSKLITQCKVLDFTGLEDKISKNDLIGRDIKKGDFVLFKTKNSEDEEFKKSFVYLDKSGAEYLSDKGIAGVATDGLGIERAQPEHETHKILFAAGIIIIEGLRLKDIEEGEYMMFALPLKITRVEAAPARVILIKD
jgi:arylformamidase